VFLVVAALATVWFSTASHAADGQVQYRDIRNESPGVVELSGSTASGLNRIALKVLGGTDDINRAIYLAAQHIEKMTDRDVFFIHVNDDNPNDDETKIEIWASGLHTSTLKVYSTSLMKEKLVAVVNDGIKRIKARDEEYLARKQQKN